MKIRRGKKNRLNRGSNSQPPGHESDMLTTEPPGRGCFNLDQSKNLSSGNELSKFWEYNMNNQGSRWASHLSPFTIDFVKWRKKMHIGENEWRRYFSYQGTIDFGIGSPSLLKFETRLWLKYR